MPSQATVREFPILFSGPMIQALLANRKFVTRRLSSQWDKVKAGDRLWVRETWGWYGRIDAHSEEWGGLEYRADGSWRGFNTFPDPDARWHDFLDAKDANRWNRWRPSIHMPRWASRILLEVEEDTRQERLQDIREIEAEAEGITEFFTRDAVAVAVLGSGLTPYPSKVNAFAYLWSTLHTKPGERWEDNPIVRRVGKFKRIDGDTPNEQ